MHNLSNFQLVYIASVVIFGFIVGLGKQIKIRHKSKIMTIKEWFDSGVEELYEHDDNYFYEEYYLVVLLGIMILIPYLNTIMTLFLLQKIAKGYILSK